VVDIFSEVDEDLRREKLEKAWKKYAPYIIGLIVIFIGGMAGRVYWKDYEESKKIIESDHYQAAIAALHDGRDQEAQTELEAISKGSNEGYELLAQLQLAGDQAKQDNLDEALSIYDQVSGNTKFEDRYRQFANLMAGMILVDQDRYDEARVRLAQLEGEDSFWSFSAQEMLGLMALEQENYDEAADIFRTLSITPNTPQEMKARAGEFLQIIDIRRPNPAPAEDVPLAEGEEPVAQEESPEN